MATNRKLNAVESFKLFGFIQDPQTGFMAKRMSDHEYATYASNILGFSLTIGNIQGARSALNIPATQNAAASAAKTAAQEVTDKLSSIEDKVNRIYRYLSEQAKRDL